MNEFLSALPWVVITGVGGWFGHVFVLQMTARNTARLASVEAEIDIEKHRDGLTFEVLAMARGEIATLTKQIKELRPLEAHLYHLEQALEHLENLLHAEPETRASIERNAKAFVTRMRRLAEARGTVANEIQIMSSTEHMAEKLIRDTAAGKASDN